MADVTPTDISKEEVRALIQKGAQLVEVLSKAQYERAHLQGAVSIPLETIGQQTVNELKRDKPVILYCYDYQ